MPTIKDVAREAGVSHGTVSNALSGRGHVSLEKMRRVRQAADRLGYTYNERAAALRSGQPAGMALLLPDISSCAYADFYAGFCAAAAQNGQGVQLHVTDNMPSVELKALRDAINARVLGIASVSSIAEGALSRYMTFQDRARLLFIERSPGEGAPFLGYDFALAGKALAERAIADGARRAGVMTNLHCYPCEKAFFEAARARFEAAGVTVAPVQAVAHQYVAHAFEFCRAGVDVVLTSCQEMARCVLAAWRVGGRGDAPALYAISPRRAVPLWSHTVYEMDYHLLGRKAYQALCGQPGPSPAAGGLRPSLPARSPSAPGGEVRLLTQESPFTNALRLLSPSLQRETGLRLIVTAFGRNELFDAVEALGGTDAYDLIRLDMSWIDWYAARFFAPLDELGWDVPGIMRELIPGMDGEYTRVNGVRYTLPLEPSALMLFYRRDLFENADIRRSFYEATRRELRVPESYDEYNRVAAFFTKSLQPGSPTLYGSTSTHAASELTPRLLCALETEQVGAFDAPVCVQALRHYLESRRYAFQAGVDRWTDTVDQFIAGRCAMAILYTNYVQHIAANPVSHVAGRVGLSALPGGVTLLGGGVVGVPRASRRKNAARDFLRWVYGRDTAQQLALLSGCSASLAAYENQEARALYPWMSTVRDSFGHGVRRGAYSPVSLPFNTKAFEGHIAIACKSAEGGVMTPEEAMAYVQRVYQGG